ncbi:thiamine biosynthesis lipoprotein [Nocardioides scoriae]|uniref:FAD:protein FMN transferase n=1 Tax=Nocardioides scoriae TaxID=642780 RepID=A0A1H1V6I5_9ACTN|nr:FAD:protein FMN transferase [Nocardioides scoriae]SDS80367.1 thiamine biosynthesis lipoprotein [Nocardioides scoriae]
MPVHRRVEHVMGMPISLALRGRHAADAQADAAWDHALAVLREADRVFSTYRADSVVSRLQRAELALDDCPREVHEVLALGERARVESDGAFDVRRAGPDGALVLDPSGVVKGWAVDRAFRAFDDLRATDVCLAAGGDLACRTALPGSQGWRIGVEDPHDASRVLAVVPARDGAVATSGLAHRGAHLVDARTGTTPADVASVTVVAADLVTADLDATSAFARGGDAARWLGARPGRAGVVVWADGRAEVVGRAD